MAKGLFGAFVVLLLATATVADEAAIKNENEALIKKEIDELRGVLAKMQEEQEKRMFQLFCFHSKYIHLFYLLCGKHGNGCPKLHSLFHQKQRNQRIL